MELKSKKIGVAGCGAMGLPMAKALLEHGFDVNGFDVRPACEFGDFSPHMQADVKKFSQDCDIVICVVRDEAQILDLCFDVQRVFGRSNPPTTLILSSTVSPRFVLKLRELLPDGVVLVDAPMSGAPMGAIKADLTFMLGGESEEIFHLLPLFRAMGSHIFQTGDLGSAMMCKVLNNYVAASCVVAVREVLHQAQQNGLSRDTLMGIMARSSGQTWFGSNFEAIDWAGQAYDGQNTMGILEKDVKAYLDVAGAKESLLHQGLLESLRAMPLDHAT